MKNKVIDKTSDVLSAPARMTSNAKIRQSTRDFQALRTARAYDDAPNFDNFGRPTNALKARTAADEVRQRLGALKK